MKKVVAIAGFDPSIGAGLITDIYTLSKLGVFAYAVETSVVAQNSKGVFAKYNLPSKIIAQQLEAIVAERGIKAIKIGLVGSKKSIELVADFIDRLGVRKIVLDPIIWASDGTRLLNDSTIDKLKRVLMPKVQVVMPNVKEAGKLTGISLSRLSEALEVAKSLRALGVPWVLIKGGHWQTKIAQDFLLGPNYQTVLAGEVVEKEVRGTGCIFASAVTAFLAADYSVPEAIVRAKEFTLEMMKSAEKIGRGRHQFNPLTLFKNLR
jgi:hydroxymethylpyrimidine kinase/phosphomethylpyrimidine kinase